MSIQSATDFVNRANQDEAIRAAARARFSEIENVGRDHGFDFSQDEFRQAMQQRKAATGDTDDQKTQVCQCGGPDPKCQAGEGDTVCQCIPDKGGESDAVCQCGPESCTSGGGSDSTTCQCGETSTCQCGETDAQTCQCGEGGGGNSTTCQCGA